MGWDSPIGSVSSHTQASSPCYAATREIRRSRAGSANALNPPANTSASMGWITLRTTGVQHSVSSGSSVPVGVG